MKRPALALAVSLVLAGCSANAPSGSGGSGPSEPPASIPAPTPSGPAATPGRPAPTETRLLVVGDIMLGRRVAVPGRPVAPLRYLARRIRSADIAVGNLESTLSDGGPPQQGGDSFAAPPGHPVTASLGRTA